MKKKNNIRKTIVAYYSPPDNLPPAIIGGLLKGSVNTDCVSATIVDLARRGYLRIRQRENQRLFLIQKEYVFEKLKSEVNLRLFEQKIIKAMFRRRNNVSITELRNQFYKQLPDIKKEINREIKKLTEKRTEIKQKALGFREYLCMTDKSEIFLDFSAYLTIFGLKKQWLNKNFFPDFTLSMSDVLSSSPNKFNID